MNSKKIIICTLIICVGFLNPFALIAQPENMFVRYINNGEENHAEINDLYDTGEDYLMAGGVTFAREGEDAPAFWLLGTSRDGEVIWQETYLPDGEPLQYCRAFTVIQTDDGGYVLGGERGQSNLFSIMKLNSDREIEWWNRYGNNVTKCKTVIELKSDELLGASYYRFGENWFGYVVKLDMEGEIIWERSYQGPTSLRTIRETEGGYVIGGGRHLIKIDEDGDLLWHRTHDIHARQLISCRNGGFALCGARFPDNENAPSRFRLLRVDDEGRQIWLGDYDSRNGGDPHEPMASLTEMGDGGFMMVGGGEIRDRVCTILRTDSAGEELWRRNDRWGGGYNYYSAVLLDDDGFAVATGGCRRNNRQQEGVIVKLIPMVSAPMIISFDPEILEFYKLQGDSSLFYVEVIDLQDDSLYFTWKMDDDTVSIDTSTTITFDEPGDITVKCVVSDGELADSVMWLAHVGEFYIDTHTPDSLSWTIRRPREVDFELGVRAVDGVEPRFRWILTGHRGAWEDVGDAPNLTYEFDRPGEYRLEGRAFHDGTVHSVTWQIAVNSVLYWWTPHERELTIDQHEEIEFNLLPFNPNSDSLDFQWLIDGEHDENELDAGLFYSFGDLGDHSVTAIVHDGVEVDTVIWSITVEDPNAVEDGTEGLLPTEVTLYPAAPNPFNSTTRVRYFLPRSADVRLTVYDSAGRLIQILSEDWTVAGEHRATLHGSELPAGVYLLRLETGDAVRSMKVVLLK